MFTKSNQTTSDLDKALDSAYTMLHNTEEDTELYAQILDQIVKLNKMKNENSSSVSKDTLALIGANLAGILLIITHEHTNVIATKAMSLVVKPK
jgi:methylthioribose-1-phosphate isomerase